MTGERAALWGCARRQESGNSRLRRLLTLAHVMAVDLESIEALGRAPQVVGQDRLRDARLFVEDAGDSFFDHATEGDEDGVTYWGTTLRGRPRGSQDARCARA